MKEGKYLLNAYVSRVYLTLIVRWAMSREILVYVNNIIHYHAHRADIFNSLVSPI